jgi:hypothetical protein
MGKHLLKYLHAFQFSDIEIADRKLVERRFNGRRRLAAAASDY